MPAGPTGAGVRVAARLALVAAAVAAVVAGAPLLLPLLPAGARPGALRLAARAVLGAAGVRVEVDGPRWLGSAGVLVVANHVSWVEVVALYALAPVRTVAKAEVGGWPVVRGVARTCGTLFVDRDRPRTLPASVAAVRRALQAGDVVAAFPEGTTWCGDAAGPFRRAVFQAAVDAGAPVRPVAVTFHTPDGRPTRAAAFVGAEDLATCLLRVLRLPGLVCRLTVLPAIRPGGDRALLARQAGAAIGAVTGAAHGAGRDALRPARARRRPAPSGRSAAGTGRLTA